MQKPIQPTPKPLTLRTARPLKIVVLGGLSQIKGADVVESLALLASVTDLPIEIHLLGFAYRELRQEPQAKLTVHGSYIDPDLPQLLDALQADVAWFPALWPETYSYTLSACLEQGLPIVAPDLGAFAERLANRPWTWICDWQQTPESWADFFVHIRQTHFTTGQPPRLPGQPVFQAPTGHDFDYRNSYLQGLRIPTAPDAIEISLLAQDICNAQTPAANASQVTKSMTLRLLQKLKGMRLLSPLVKALPLHLQRRTKSWLLR